MKERGYCFCSDKKGKLHKGKEVIGTESAVTFPVNCPSGAKLKGTFHTHPSGDLRPSHADLKVRDRFNIPICIGTSDGRRIKCYRPLLRNRRG